MDRDDLKLFSDSLRQAAERHTDGDPRGFDAALEDLGWRDALLDEPSGATAALFAVQGEFNLASCALDDVVLAALGVDPDRTVAAVLPASGTHTPPGTLLSSTPVRDGRLIVRGLGSARLLDADEVVIVARRDGEPVVLRLAGSDLDVRAVAGIDPWGSWTGVETALTAATAGDAIAADWEQATIRGQLALAQELTATSRAMLDLARDHAVGRIQFGRPIGSFQAVRHRLADCLLAVESAQAACDAGWATPTRFTAGMAKVIAGRAGRTVARHAQQVLAGMGFTSEHAFHRYLKRALVLDALFGSADALSTEIATEVLATGRLPEPLGL
ncbi:MAG TPA: acyl-CoA dehydrogenase family protein [Mycobacteriales bacterium]|nr:acyl-CoA dehydrogenase family protein [Mycobacteriales bacterium]